MAEYLQAILELSERYIRLGTMKKLIFLIILTSLCYFSFAQTNVIKLKNLESLLNKKEGSIQVINFWATWCGPCVKEIPLFENLSIPNTTVTLISVDFVEKLSKVNDFVIRKKIKSNVLLLDEIDYNSWIDKVDKSWEGAIPATLIYNPANGKRSFIQHELKEGELEPLILSVQ